MNKDRKIVFFDVDDTLIYHRGDKSYIPDSTKETIVDLKKSGHVVAIASGRGHEQIKGIMGLLGIDHAVCFNGHMVVIDHQIVYHETLNNTDTSALIRRLRRSIMPMIAMDAENAYIKDLFGGVQKKLARSIKEVEGAEGDVYLGLFKKFREGKPPYTGLMFFKRKFKDQDKYPNLSFKDWGGLGYEVSNKGTSKLSGILHMAEIFGIKEKDIIVFGDNYNDIEMLEGIEHSVAMGNGVAAAKEAATYVTDHIKDHGIHNACHRLGLIRRERQ